jgi:zinc finger protein
MTEDYEIPAEEITEVQCPNCDEKLYYIQMMTNIAFEKQILIQTYFCKKCLFKKNEVIQIDRGEPVREIITVRNGDDLRTVVYRSPEARILIPEIEAEIEPGEISSGEVTTIEGIITRLCERMDSALFDFEGTKEEEKEANVKMDAIKSMKIFPFTLIVEDESGMSRIQSSRATIEKIDKNAT